MLQQAQPLKNAADSQPDKPNNKCKQTNYIYSRSQNAVIHSAPIQDLGKNAKIVPIIARIDEITITTQFKILSAGGIVSPNIRRWNSSGRMTQIIKHKQEPINAMMLSNAGKTIANKTKETITTTRIAIFWMPRPNFEHPTRASSLGTVHTSRPVSASRVATIGLAFRGSLVSGMMAMKMQRSTVNACGYPLVRIILLVTESRTPSPYMR